MIQWTQHQLNVEVPSFVKLLTGDVKGLKIAVPKEYLGEGVGEEVRHSVLEALKVLEGLALSGKKYRCRILNMR